VTTTITLPGVELLPEYQEVVVKPRARDYLIDGARYQRVSTMLGIINKPALVPWAKRTTLARVEEILRDPKVKAGLTQIFAETLETGDLSDYDEWVDLVMDSGAKAADEARDEAADKGHNAHAQIAQRLNGEPEQEDGWAPQVGQALRFLSEWGLVVDQTEMTVWSPELEVAGTCDAIGHRIEGTRVIWDWKTGSGPWWEMALQLGAYAEMFRGLTGQAVTRAWIVKLLEDHYQVYPVLDLPAAWDAFKTATGLKRYSAVRWFPKDPF